MGSENENKDNETDFVSFLKAIYTVQFFIIFYIHVLQEEKKKD